MNTQAKIDDLKIDPIKLEAAVQSIVSYTTQFMADPENNEELYVLTHDKVKSTLQKMDINSLAAMILHLSLTGIEAFLDTAFLSSSSATNGDIDAHIRAHFSLLNKLDSESPLPEWRAEETTSNVLPFKRK